MEKEGRYWYEKTENHGCDTSEKSRLQNLYEEVLAALCYVIVSVTLSGNF